MARPDELIGIGEFARRVRLSVKQLRSYDELGLLAPAYVDPDSGYRYYHRGQARTAITIALLRSLDVPLTTVHELLVADRADAKALLAGQHARLQGELEQRRRTVRALERLIDAEELLPYAVVTRDEPTRSLSGLHGRCAAERLDTVVPELIARLDASDTPVFGVYPLELEGDIEFFVGVEGDGDVVLRGGPALTTTHVGAYEELALAYYPLLAHAHEHGLTPARYVLEVYLDDTPRTEVLLPIS